MKSDLDLIIEFYEEEKRVLEQEIKDALAEGDYEDVYHRGEALNRVKSQLYRMNGLKDPLYETKKQIARLRELNGIDELNEFDLRYLAELIPRTNTISKPSIDELLRQKFDFVDEQEIDDALFDLYEGKCRAFGFCFPHRDEDLCLLFELTAEKILLISVDVKDITSKYDPDDPEEKQTHLFENLGFHYDSYGSTLVYQYEMANFKNALEIKILLSRIIYDIGYFGQKKQGTIEFYD